jgi:probable HAF family extracellular repeat protein
MLLLCAVAMALITESAGAQTSALVDLGVGTGYGINNSGQVILSSGLYSNGTVTPLPPLPGTTTPAVGIAINDSGLVAGNASGVAISYLNGTLTNIEANPAFFFSSSTQDSTIATGVSANGQIVGAWILPTCCGVGFFVYSSGGNVTGPTDPNCTGTDICSASLAPPINVPLGINDTGEFTGTFADPPSAFLYSNGAFTTIGPGVGYAINNAGQVTGTLAFNGGANTYAFLYTSATPTNLGALPGGTTSTGYAINATGQIVGASGFTGSNGTHAFFYSGVMIDLNSLIGSSDPLKPYVTLTEARGINNGILVLANGVDSRTNLGHAYLIQAPSINFTPGTLSFGAIAVGATSATQTVTVTNAGAAPASVSVSVSANFLQTNNCGTSLAAGAQCTATVAFKPTVAGALSGGLTVTSSGVNYVVPLSGTAPVTASLTPSAAVAFIGQPLTLTWTSSPGATCTATASSQNKSFKGSIAHSGTVSLTEITAGAVTYAIHCSAPGTSSVGSSTSVTWSLPTVTVSMSASPATITTGQSTVLTWVSTYAASCTATGGGVGDGWPGTKAANGSQTVTEAYALATSSVSLKFTLTCSATVNGPTATSSAQVTENAAPKSGGGGGGTLDVTSLLALGGLIALRRRLTSRHEPATRSK